jgi:hypothetical protein
MRERRRSARQKSFLRGCIYFNNRRAAVDCLIRDISRDGARLIFSDTVTTPDLVELYIPQKEQTVRARVHWRHGQEVGVGFDTSATAARRPIDVGDLVERVQSLEAEIATLRRTVRRLKSATADADEVA